MDNERYKPEFRDFERRFQDHLDQHKDELDKVPPEKRADVEAKIRGRLQQFEHDEETLQGQKGYDFYKPEYQGKWMSLVEFVNHDTLMQIREAQGAQKDKAQESWDRLQERRGREQERDHGVDRERER